MTNVEARAASILLLFRNSHVPPDETTIYALCNIIRDWLFNTSSEFLVENEFENCIFTVKLAPKNQVKH